MFARRIPVRCLLAVLLITGCRRDDPPFDDGPVLPPDGSFVQQMSFNWTGLPSSFRQYSRLWAAYNPATNIVSIETRNDSLQFGLLQLAVRGNAPGTYRYSMNGSPGDTNQVFMRFVPLYYNGLPSAEFVLTGRPADSLEAEVTIRLFGGPGDTIAGSFTGTLTPPAGGGPRILIYGGAFIARRAE
jgi:hypothetical protein